MTLESVYDVHRTPSREFTLICRHPDEEMADCCRGLISAWTRGLQLIFAHYWTLEDCFHQSSFLYSRFFMNRNERETFMLNQNWAIFNKIDLHPFSPF